MLVLGGLRVESIVLRLSGTERYWGGLGRSLAHARGSYYR